MVVPTAILLMSLYSVLPVIQGANSLYSLSLHSRGGNVPRVLSFLMDPRRGDVDFQSAQFIPIVTTE